MLKKVAASFFSTSRRPITASASSLATSPINALQARSVKTQSVSTPETLNAAIERAKNINPSKTDTTTATKWSARDVIKDSVEELGEDFTFEGYLKKQEEQRQKRPPRQGSTVVRPSLSQATKARYMKNPYKLDSKGQPVWDYFNMPAFNRNRYPAIEVNKLYLPKKERYEYEVKTVEEANRKLEFRCGVTSEELLAAGASVVDPKVYPHVQVPANDNSYMVARAFSWNNASLHELNKKEIQSVIYRFQTHMSDTASKPVLVAVLTTKINHLTEHLKMSHKDRHAKRKLAQLIARRKRVLLQLRMRDGEQYWKALKALDLRVQLWQ